MAGLDAFKMLRSANAREEYSTVVEILCGSLFMEDSMELLPLLKGTLAEVIRRQDEATLKAKTKAKKSSAFGKFGGPDGSGYPGRAAAEEDESAPSNRWQHLLRAMFNAEAACALLEEVLVGYRGEEFLNAAKTMNDSWGAYDVYEDQMASINAMCLEKVLGAVLRRYGFTWDERGNQDISTVVASLATTSSEVAMRQIAVQKQVFSSFPALGTGVVPALSSGAPVFYKGGLTGVRQQPNSGSEMDKLDSGFKYKRGNGDAGATADPAAGADRSGGMWTRDAVAKAAAGAGGARPPLKTSPGKFERESFPEDSD